jgi:predicted AlkP superfamily phosphohydrolase/phosphomutase
MTIFKPGKKNRVCVIGLDGVPYGMVLDLAGRGVMPAMGRLLASGRLHKMKASLPEISAVSWTNFMTGANPGTHGIFGFTDFKPGSYEIRFPNFLDMKAPTIWQTLADKGKKSVVINQPSTYPARPVNGVLVSGFVALELAKAVYPLGRLAVLEKMGYRTDIDTLKCRRDPDFLWRELTGTLAGHEKAVDAFWREPWDFFEFVITGTDRLHHFLWDAYADPLHPFHERFLAYYREVDRLVGKIAASFRESAGGEKGLYILSDHGFTGIVQEVYLNAWLERNGYLSFEVPEPRGLEDVQASSRAFALDPNRIYLNLKGRFPKGCVDASERRGLLEEIAGKLGALEHDGGRVVRRVFYSEDIYSGPYTTAGPDLIVLGEPGFDMKGSVKKKVVFDRTDLQGMHTWEDAFFWAASDHGPDLAIADIAEIILGNYA